MTLPRQFGPKTCPRPSLGPHPAIEEFRLHGGIYRRAAENAEGLFGGS